MNEAQLTAGEYVIIHKRICDMCEGTGYHYNMQWNAANKAFDAASREQKINALTKFWIDAGYGANSKRWPPEELDCPDCEGVGIIQNEVRLEVALAHLGIEVSI